ncbi:MAG TPA: LysR family transcriptional regulator [Acetobacteraceae bacterium]|nr:LysR family transcriptional regulator [Acetobacteraceae bacterium]
MDRLDAMRAFVAVADLSGFAAAARHLRLSPAAVTRAVAQLEQQLGLTLLHRTTRTVRLTERGALYLESSRRILEDLRNAERLARGEDAAPRGTLVIAAPLMFGRLHVLPIITGLLRQHRDLSARLLLSDRIVHLAEEGVDAAVRIGSLADSALRAVKVGEVRRVLVASPAYLATHGIPATPAALPRHDIIVPEGGGATDTWRFGERGGTAVRVTPRLAVSTADAAIDAAEAGLGITRALSYQVHEAVLAGRLQPVLAEYAPAAWPVQLVHAAQRQGSANLTAFLAAARQHFRALAVIAPGGQPASRHSRTASGVP